MSIDEYYANKFKDVTISLVDYDNGATPESMAAYVLVEGLDKAMMKNKGSTVLDLGNYIYGRWGIHYFPCPEYHKKGCPKNSVAFYISKQNMERMPHIQDWIIKVHNEKRPDEAVRRWQSGLYFLRRLTIKAPEPEVWE